MCCVWSWEETPPAPPTWARCGATTGEEALKHARTFAPDLILLDLSLPGLDGWAAAQQLKGHPATQRIPIVALTAHAMRGDREKALDAGCDDCATKPAEFTRLLRKSTRSSSSVRAAEKHCR